MYAGLECTACNNKRLNLTSVVLGGQRQQLEVHVLAPNTLQLHAKWQLPPSCSAAAISPNGCSLATVHQTPEPLPQRSLSASDRHTHPPHLAAQSQALPEQDEVNPMSVDPSTKQDSLPNSAAGSYNPQQPPDAGAIHSAPVEVSSQLVDTQLLPSSTNTVDVPNWASEITIAFSVVLPEASRLVQSAHMAALDKEVVHSGVQPPVTSNISSTDAMHIKQEGGLVASDDSSGLQQLTEALLDRCAFIAQCIQFSILCLHSKY